MIFQPRAKKAYVYGWVIGILMAIATFLTTAIVVPTLVAIANCKPTLSKFNTAIPLLWLLLVCIIGSKTLQFDVYGEYLIKDLFLITALAGFSILRLHPLVLRGVVWGFLPIALLDASSNMMQLATGQGLFGTTSSQFRTDGLRLTGLFGNSFFSISIYLAIFLAMYGAGFGRLKSWPFLVMMVLVGSLRSIVIILLIPIFKFVFRLPWALTFLFSLSTPLSIAAATYYSVELGFFDESSGNAYRLFAWNLAASEISEAPYFGADTPPRTRSDSFSINRENIEYYQIYESTLLQDAVRYGVFFVFFKLVFFYQIGREIYTRLTGSVGPSLISAKNMVGSLLVIDYCIFSFFGMPVLALVAALVIAAKDDTNGPGKIGSRN